MKHTTMFCLCLFFLAGCVSTESHDFRGDVADNAKTPWTHLDFHNDPDDFQFAIVSDRTGYKRPGVFEKAVEELNMLQPEFVLCVGDLIEGYRDNRDDVNAMWDEFEGIVAQLEMPFFHMPGNHDLSNELMKTVWQERFGPTYYHFVYRNVLFLIVNTEDPPLAQVELKPDISSEQRAYFEKVLKQHDDVRWTFVFMHEPAWGPTEEKTHPQWAALEAILAKRPYTVFAGHWHHYTTYERQGRDYYVLATTGGASELRGPNQGEFDHFVWVTMTSEGPSMANIVLDGVLGPDGGKGTPDKVSLRAVDEAIQTSFAPVFTPDSIFRGGTTTFNISNSSPVPVDATVEFAQHDSAKAKPAALELHLEPKTEQELPVAIVAQGGLDMALVDPITAYATLSFTLPGEDQPQRIVRRLGVPIHRTADVLPAEAAITVDGRLDDWPTLRFVCDQPTQVQFNPTLWQGIEDCSFRFDARHNDAYLYLAVDVSDNEPLNAPERYPWCQDATEIRLDARPEPQRSAGRGDNEFQDLLLISIIPGQNAGQAYQHDKLPEGVQAVCTKTDTGHITEAAIPVAYLDAKQGGPWQALRLNVAVDDYDPSEGATAQSGTDTGAQLWWQPDWRTPANQPGSGTFLRR